MASTNITVSQPAYERLKKLKHPGQSFSDVILTHFAPPLDTAGEVLDALEKAPAPRGLDWERADAYLKDRKRRSNRK